MMSAKLEIAMTAESASLFSRFYYGPWAVCLFS